MSYRDDRDADLARIDALEAELAAANRKVDELEGRSQNALVLAGGNSLELAGRRSASTRWLGAPLDLEMTKTFDGEFPVDKFEDLIVVIRSATRDVGNTEILKSSMVWRASGGQRSSLRTALVVMVMVKDGRTTLTVGDRLGQLAGAIYGGVGGGVGGGTMAAPLFASMAVPILTPVFVIGWIGAVWGGTRAIFKRAARSRARAVQRLFDTLDGEIAKALSP